MIGSGVSGVFAAITVASSMQDCDVTIVEATKTPLRRLSFFKCATKGSLKRAVVQVEGFESPAAVISNYPRGGVDLVNILSSHHGIMGDDVVSWFEKEGVKMVATADGGFAPTSGNSTSMADALIRVAHRLGISFRKSTNVTCIDVLSRNSKHLGAIGGSSAPGRVSAPVYRVSYSETKTLWRGGAYEDMATKRPRKVRTTGHFDCDILMLATGESLSGHSLARSLGHLVADQFPSLFHFCVFDSNSPRHLLHGWQGTSLNNVLIEYEGKAAIGPVQFSHTGLAGQAVLKLSALAAEEMHAEGHRGHIRLTILPDIECKDARHALRKHAEQVSANTLMIGNRFSLPPLFVGRLPGKVWRSLVTASALQVDRKLGPKFLWKDLCQDHEKALAGMLTSPLSVPLCGIQYNGIQYNGAQSILAGGLDPSQVDPHRMESSILPGVFFGGSLLNIDGLSSGFNFQAAWTTGYAAGKGMEEKAQTMRRHNNMSI